MRLMTAHKILIATGSVFFLLFAVLQWRQGAPSGAILGLAAAVALAGYFTTLRGR